MFKKAKIKQKKNGLPSAKLHKRRLATEPQKIQGLIIRVVAEMIKARKGLRDYANLKRRKKRKFFNNSSSILYGILSPNT